MRRTIAIGMVLACAGTAWAQLPPVPESVENPITEDKRILGKILFWDEQLSSDSTVACGTCHDPGHAGTDARLGIHAGLDGLFGTADDVIGSPGVARQDALGLPIPDPMFGHEPQVTRRAANTVINSGFVPELFWDGRAGSAFIDPQTGALSIGGGGALESQSVIPIVSDVEMAREGRTWTDVVNKLQAAEPLRLSADIPPDLVPILSASPSYADLFEQAFGDPAINSERIAFALATYERTLVADQTPWDRFIGGDPTALTPDQQQGWNTFRTSPCAACHSPPFFTGNTFRNIGLRPVAEDSGREEVTGLFGDRGRFKVPTLRNVGLKSTFMHTGEFTTLFDVLTFYQPGNQVLDNLDPLMPVPLPNPLQVIDFLENGLTDLRVMREQFPFDHPAIFGGSDPRTLLFFDADRATIRWPAPIEALAYRIYRGDLATMADGDADGLPDAGYGDCVTGLDPNDTDTVFVDGTIPATTQGFFYLKSLVDVGGEGELGWTSAGLQRLPATACP